MTDELKQSRTKISLIKDLTLECFGDLWDNRENLRTPQLLAAPLIPVILTCYVSWNSSRVRDKETGKYRVVFPR